MASSCCLVLLLLSSAVHADPIHRRPDPGPETAEAYAQLGTEQTEAACAVLIEQLKDRSPDPWVYSGVALCSMMVPELHTTILTILGDFPHYDPLVLLARGSIYWLDGETATAERWLSQAVDLEPELALAWNVLSAIALQRGDWQKANELLETVLALSPELQTARDVQASIRHKLHVFERLTAFLEALPKQWAALPEPRIALSGSAESAISGTAPAEAKQEALQFISHLAYTPAEQQEAMIERVFEERGFREIDLWVPLHLAHSEQSRGDFDELALTLEATLRLAATLGHREVLSLGAGLAFHVLQSRQKVETLEPIIQSWIDLPLPRDAQRGFAFLRTVHGGLLTALGRHQEALEGFSIARRIYRELGDELGSGNTWFGEGESLYFLGEYDRAISAFREARRLFEELGDPHSVGKTWVSQAECHFFLGETRKALAMFERARQIFGESDRLGQAHAWAGKAKVLIRLGANDEAILALGQARRRFQAIGEARGEADTWFREARVRLRLGEVPAARAALQSALQGFEALGDRLGQGNALRELAHVQSKHGEIEQALTNLRHARNHYEILNDAQGLGVTWDSEADVLAVLGEHEDALDAHRRARRFFEAADDRLGEGYTYHGEASLLRQLGEYENARLAQDAAARLFEVMDDPGALGNARRGQGDIYFQTGQPQKALDAYREARRLFEAVDEQEGQGAAWGAEADVLYALGVDDEAASAAARAARFFEQTGTISNQIRALLREAEGRLRLGEAPRALHLARSAIELHETWRGGFVAEEHRTDQEENIRRAYDVLVPTLLRREGGLEDALTFAEQARSRVLFDLLVSEGVGDAEFPETLRRERDHMHTQLAQVSSQLETAFEPDRRRELLTRRSALDADLQRNLYRTLAEQPGPRQLGQPLDATRLRRLAREIGPISLYYVTESELICFLILPSGRLVPLSVEVPRDLLAATVETMVFDLANPMREQQSLETAEQLWTWLFSRAAEHLPPGGPLTIVPHGPLHSLPFEALVDPETGQRLFERWDLTLTPSVSVLAFARRERHRPQREQDTFVAFAGGGGLLFSQREVEKVSEIFRSSRGRTFGPRETDYPTYLEEIGSARQVLIATRGVSSSRSRRGTYLEIRSTPGVHDDRLTAAEIATIPLDAELVTIAACDVDRGDALLSDERLTLTRSFLIAGAASVLTTRWRIPEVGETARFLGDFYRFYRRGGPAGRGMRKDRALTLARARAVERGVSAQIWAAWVLFGDAR